MYDFDDTWRIAIPTSLLDPIINWYHQMLDHVGMTRLNATISTHFILPSIKSKSGTYCKHM